MATDCIPLISRCMARIAVMPELGLANVYATHAPVIAANTGTFKKRRTSRIIADRTIGDIMPPLLSHLCSGGRIPEQ